MLATAIGTAGAYAIRQLDGKFAVAMRMIFMLPMIALVILIAVGVFVVYARLGLNNSVEGQTNPPPLASELMRASSTK